MKILPQELEALRKLIVRDNLGPIFPASVLIRMVYDATAHPCWNPSPKSPPESISVPDPVLRSILTYSYATGIFSSLEIESAARHDPAVAYLCANHHPDWQAIRQFRRRNMPGLKRALATLFALALRETEDSSHRFEAERRLARAIQADSYALDL